MNETSILFETLKASGLPVVEVEIGDLRDRSTWKVQLSDRATPADHQAARALVTAFDVESKPTRDAVSEQAARAFANSRQIRASWLWLFRMLNRRDPTDEEKTAAEDALVQAYKDTPP